jgi:hypothetical protein
MLKQYIMKNLKFAYFYIMYYFNNYFKHIYFINVLYMQITDEQKRNKLMIQLIHKLYTTDKSQLTIIGHGLSGEVVMYDKVAMFDDVMMSNISDQIKKHVFKISILNEKCTNLKNEFNMNKCINEGYIEFKKNRNNENEFVEFTQLKDYMYFEETKSCILMLERVYNLYENNKTIQVMLGMDDFDFEFDGGIINGITQLKELFLNLLHDNDTYILFKQYVYQLGRLMGFLHFIIKIDAFDVEVYFGKNQKKEYKMFIADFDQCNKISEYDEKTIIKMSQSFYMGMEHFPNNRISDLTIYMEFKNGYMSIVSEDTKKCKIAIKVLEYYDIMKT